MLEGFADLDMSVDVDTTQSTSGYVMTCPGGAVLWQSRLQKAVALSTTEVEYMVVVDAGKEMIWMREFVGQLGVDKVNSDCTATTKVPSTLQRMRHTIPE